MAKPQGFAVATMPTVKAYTTYTGAPCDHPAMMAATIRAQPAFAEVLRHLVTTPAVRRWPHPLLSNNFRPLASQVAQPARAGQVPRCAGPCAVERTAFGTVARPVRTYGWPTGPAAQEQGSRRPREDVRAGQVRLGRPRRARRGGQQSKPLPAR